MSDRSKIQIVKATTSCEHSDIYRKLNILSKNQEIIYQQNEKILAILTKESDRIEVSYEVTI